MCRHFCFNGDVSCYFWLFRLNWSIWGIWGIRILWFYCTTLADCCYFAGARDITLIATRVHALVGVCQVACLVAAVVPDNLPSIVDSRCISRNIETIFTIAQTCCCTTWPTFGDSSIARPNIAVDFLTKIARLGEEYSALVAAGETWFDNFFWIRRATLIVSQLFLCAVPSRIATAYRR